MNTKRYKNTITSEEAYDRVELGSLRGGKNDPPRYVL